MCFICAYWLYGCAKDGVSVVMIYRQRFRKLGSEFKAERPEREYFLKVRAPSSLSSAGRSASDRSGRSFRHHLCISQMSLQVHSGTAGALTATYNCECRLLSPGLGAWDWSLKAQFPQHYYLI